MAGNRVDRLVLGLLRHAAQIVHKGEGCCTALIETYDIFAKLGTSDKWEDDLGEAFKIAFLTFDKLFRPNGNFYPRYWWPIEEVEQRILALLFTAEYYEELISPC